MTFTREPIEPDALLVGLAADLADPEVELDGPRRYSSPALRVRGRAFAYADRGRLALRLPHARIAELVAAGIAEPRRAADGRASKDVAMIAAEAQAALVDLSRESMHFVWEWPILPLSAVRAVTEPIVLDVREIRRAYSCLLELLLGLRRPSDRPPAPAGREAFSGLFDRLRDIPGWFGATDEASVVGPPRFFANEADRSLIAYAIEVVIRELGCESELHARTGAWTAELQALLGRMRI